MKMLFALIVAMAIFATSIFQAVNYLRYYETKITEDEIVIGRMTGFGSASTYAVDRRTGDEELISRGYVPFLTYRYVSIKYAKSCQCVTSVFREEHGEAYYMSRYADGQVYVSTGSVIQHQDTVPYSTVAAKFEDAQASIGNVRREYSSLIPAQ